MVEFQQLGLAHKWMQLFHASIADDLTIFLTLKPPVLISLTGFVITYTFISRCLYIFCLFIPLMLLVSIARVGSSLFASFYSFLYIYNNKNNNNNLCFPLYSFQMVCKAKECF